MKMIIESFQQNLPSDPLTLPTLIPSPSEREAIEEGG